MKTIKTLYIALAISFCFSQKMVLALEFSGPPQQCLTNASANLLIEDALRARHRRPPSPSFEIRPVVTNPFGNVRSQNDFVLWAKWGLKKA